VVSDYWVDHREYILLIDLRIVLIDSLQIGDFQIKGFQIRLFSSLAAKDRIFPYQACRAAVLVGVLVSLEFIH
jgi:hypothetical protein